MKRCRFGHVLHRLNVTLVQHSKTGKTWQRCLICHALRQREYRKEVTSMTTHPLVGKYIKFDDSSDHKMYLLSRFDADLGNGLMLATRIVPGTGEDLDIRHVISLHDMADPDLNADIFSSWKAYRVELERLHASHEPASVIRLTSKEGK